MKQKFTMLITAFLLVMTSLAWGQTRTQIEWTASEQGYVNAQTIDSISFDNNVSATFSKGTNQNNPPKYYNTGLAIRCYGGNYFTISTTSGNLTEIALSFGSGDGTNAITTDVGTYNNGTWTGSATSVTFTIGGTSGHRRIAGFSITYGSGGTTQTVATPTFTPAAGTYGTAQSVTINCTTQGATIYYTTDGTTPSLDPTTALVGTQYNGPITISQTTTVKAIAVKSGMNNSSVATATYTIQQLTSINTIAGLWDYAESVGTTATPAEVTFNNWYVTGVRNSQVCVSDGQYGFVIYQANHGLTAGDKLNGTVTCNVLMYQNHYAELTGVTASNLTVTPGQEMPILTTTIGSLTTRNYGTPINLGTLVYDGTKFNDAEGNPIIPYNNFNLNPNPIESLESNTQYNVKGVYIIHWQNTGQTQQIAPRSADDFEEIGAPTQTVATPTFSPAEGTYTEAQTVTISCATQGATIYYTTDGTTPGSSAATVMNGSVYSSPITVSETTTVKAIAMMQGMNNSAVASVTYTIQTGPTLITIAAAKALAVDEYALVQGVITFIDGKNVYIQDETAGIDLYLNSAVNTLALGDKVQAYGKRAVFNGLIELSGINPSDQSQFSVISTGNPLPVVVKTIAEILNDHQTGADALQSTRVKIVDATVGEINTNNNTPITQDQNTLNIYKMPVVNGLAEGDIATVIGVVGCYNNPQLRVANANDVTFTHPQLDVVATPTFTPAAGNYTEAQTVTISCATQGATIYYTVDGTDPVAPTGILGTQYTQPITIIETTTVKAIAIMQGMENSEIATAEYIINITPPAQETAYTLITHANALISGEKYIIVGVKSDTTYKAMGKQNTNNRVAVDVFSDDNIVTLTPANQANLDGVYELTLGQEDGKWTFYDAVNGGYLYAGSSTANYLRTQARNDANGQWTIEIASDGVATIKAQGTNTRNWLRLNNSGSPFSCYASGQLNVYLYKAGDVPIPPEPTYYNVEVAYNDGGTAFAEPTEALENDTIRVTVAPLPGNVLTSLTYTYTGAAPIDIMETKWFLMPASDVTVNAVFTELSATATPTFTPAEGSFIAPLTVSIACATEGATIYYSTDGTEPTPNDMVYTEPIAVSESTTIKAIAWKEGLTYSTVASATYTILEPVTIAAARALANNEYALVEGVVTFIDGRNVYVQDATAGIDLYLNSNTVPSNLALGDLVLCYGKKTVYNGLVELTGVNGGNANEFVVVSNGNELPLAVKTVAEILADHEGSKMLQSTRVQIVDATIGAINTANNTPITQDGSTINIYKMPVVDGLEEGDFVTVTGVVGCFNNPQLRVNSAEDVEFAHPAGITLTPASLSGFNYVYEEGPSNVKSFVITASGLEGTTLVIAPESYELSSFPGDAFHPQEQVTINSFTGIYSYTIKVRLKAGLEIGTYEESLMVCYEGIDTLYVALSGSVTGAPQPTSDYVRVTDLSQVGNGSKVIFAARYNQTVNEYFAMTAQTSGKPEGVLFTSVTGTNAEILPSEITDAEDTYYWTVITDGTNYTFTNADGNVLGYTSSTNFATGGDNTGWTITPGTSEASAMVPNYSAFNIINSNVTNRAFALNNNHNFGPYHTQNMAGENYNFFIDIFTTAGGTVTPTCATPTFSPEGGTYFEEQEVVISCGTADATIYYTLDGSDPTQNSLVYTEPIQVAESMTIKAYAVKEGFNDSNIAEAEYTIILGAVTIFFQDWEGEMNGWTFVTVEGSKPWTIGQYQGNHYANANGYNGGYNEQWCISPAFNLEQYSDVSLSFLNAMNYTGPELQLFFSNDYDGEDPTTATWTELDFEMSTGSYTWVESGVISLADFTGAECYIGFMYTSTEEAAAAWEVDDILLMGYTSDPYLNVTPTALSGFTHHIGQGPSASQTFVLTAGNISPAPGGGTMGSIIMSVFSPFEISLDDEEYDNEIFFEGITNLEATTIYVRMNGTEIGQYTESVNIYASSGDEATVTLSGTVTEEPIPGGDWNRIGSLADLHDGDQLVIAARYDASVGDGYYAMTAGVSGKPDGVLFTSVNEGGVEKLPSEIADNADTYLWNVTVNGDVITLTNAAGDMLGYSTSTNFAGNTSTVWTIAYETSGENAMVPNYTGFLITNAETTNRCIVMNANYKFGAYHTNNINSADYNFYLDLFVQGGSATQTVATPVFSVPSGTYFEEFDVEITCTTEGAVIYYTTDGSDPTAESLVYEEPIHIDADVTLKAIAMLEGYDDSNIATVNYVLMTGQNIILFQDWEGEMNGWTFVTVEGNKPWSIGTYSGNKYAYANGYNDDIDNEQWCISPAFDLTYYRNVILTFRNAMKFTGPDVQLLFSTDYDGQHTSSATWSELDFVKSEGNYVWTESGEIPLDGLLRSENCYIAFLYTSNLDDGAAAWEIDDIMIVGTAYDALEETSVMDVNFWNSDNEIFVDNQTNGNVEMAVFNLLGQPVLSKTISAGSVRFSHNLATGVYVVALQNSKGRMAVKMIVK